MRGHGVALVAFLFVACGESLPTRSDDPEGANDAGADGAGSDAGGPGADAGPLKLCTLTTPFRPRALVVGDATDVTSTRFSPTLNGAQSMLFFSFIDTNGIFRIAYAAPASQGSLAFGTPIALVSGTSAHDSYPWLSLDGQRLYFASTRAAGGGWDIYRVNVASDPGATVLAGAVAIYDQPGTQLAFSFTEDERELLATTDTSIVHFAADADGRFAAPDPLADLLSSGSARENHPALSPDGLVVYFGSLRDNAGSTRIYRATRTKRDEPFGNVTKETSLEGFVSGEPSHLTRDLCRLYFFARTSETAPDFTLYVAERDPP